MYLSLYIVAILHSLHVGSYVFTLEMLMTSEQLTSKDIVCTYIQYYVCMMIYLLFKSSSTCLAYSMVQCLT